MAPLGLHTARGHAHQKAKASFTPSKVRAVALRGDSQCREAHLVKEKHIPIHFAGKIALKAGRKLWRKRGGGSIEIPVSWDQGERVQRSLISLSI